MSGHVLLVDDDAAVRDSLTQTLELAEYEVTAAASYLEAKDHITQAFAGVILSDIRMPGKDGFDLLAYARDMDADLPVILLTGEGDIPMAVRGMSSGAYGFLEKPCPKDDLLAVLGKAMRTRALVLENRRLTHQLETGDPAARLLFGTSALAEGLRQTVRAAARSGAEVLITGAPGTGVAKVAHVIHLMSRPDGPFEKRAGAALSPADITDLPQRAGDGTLFIDAIDGMPPESQMALIEVLERPDCPRVLAGTYRDLGALAHDGRFNPDLYYRLDVLSVHIPALRDRPEDIPELFRLYVQSAAEQAQVTPPDVPSHVLSDLMRRDWPGNSRDLMNAATRYALGMSNYTSADAPGLVEHMAGVEAAFLIQALRQHHGNATETAKALKLPRKTFYDKLARHGIKAEAYRN